MSHGARDAVARLALSQTWRGALAVAVANVLVTVTAVVGYVAAYPDPTDRRTLAGSIGSNPGLAALFGEPVDLESVAGFTEWRVVLVLAVLGAVWALLATSRALRGEEESGRTEALLAGPLTRTGAAQASIAGLLASLALLLTVTTVGSVAGSAADLGADRAALLALTIVGTPAAMLGVAAVTSQLAGTRRRAAGMAAAVLAVSYLVRVVADSTADLRWLRWWTPLGWLELAHPLTGPRILPILLPYLLALVLIVAAIGLVRVRDTGVGLLSSAGGRPARAAGLSHPVGLAARLALGPALAWALGLGLFGALIGLVARTAAEAMADSRGDEVLGGLGIEDAGTRGYVGVSFVLVTLALATAAAGQVASTRDEEATARLDNLLVRPVGRVGWLAGRLMVALAVVALGATSATFGTWAAGSVGGLEVSGRDLVAAGLNTLPAAVLVLGMGTLLHGVVPRAAVAVTYGVVAASFLLEIVGAAVALPSWLLNLSVLHHVSPAPAVTPDWQSAAVLVVLGVVLALAGGAALRRRDIEPA